jgi:ClpP class serine protease
MQSRVDADYDRFTRAVARHRGVEVATVRNRMGQGRMLGAEAAKVERMVDGIATLDEVVNKLSRRLIEAESNPSQPLVVSDAERQLWKVKLTYDWLGNSSMLSRRQMTFIAPPA